MSRDGSVDVKIPDLGDFKDVAVIDVLIKAGDTVAVDTPLITLETEKATMDIPSPAAGVIAEVTVRTGERVNTGSVIARLRSTGRRQRSARLIAQGRTAPHQALRESEPFGGEPYMDTVPIAPMEKPADPGKSVDPIDGAGVRDRVGARSAVSSASYDFDLAVLGAGRADTPLLFGPPISASRSRYRAVAALGGVCLNVGCIPSKALLHAARVIEEANEMAPHGIASASRVSTWPVARLEEPRREPAGGGLAALRASGRSR